MNILITGGAGFIGSHTCVELLNSGYNVIIVDNLYNSKESTLSAIKQITGKDFKFYNNDILDKPALRKIFSENEIDAVIHFAALKAVGESVGIPIKYYENNIAGTISLCDIMNEFNCKKLVFSSSATVYGMSNPVPFREDYDTSATNPYGNTKLIIETLLKDISIADSSWSMISLRYFNPVGAHPSGLIGEDPNGIPNNLVPYISKVATGELEYLNIYGNDYDTADGTGVRDYIHVVDLAIGHAKALDILFKKPGLEFINLGTGNGTSVLDVVKSYENACGMKINYKFAPRRPGDIAIGYADVNKAKSILNWQAIYDINQMCIDSWNFISKNK